MKVEIKKFDHLSRGIGRIKDKIVFVERALPDEIVDIVITSDKKSYSEGKIKSIIKESPFRIDAVCPFYKKCGGCNFLHTTYEKEKEFKKNKAYELLKKCDNFYETKKMNYRNKVTLHVLGRKIGLYEENTKKIVPINYCYLLNDRINEVVKDLQSIDFSNYKIKTIIIKEARKKLLIHLDNVVDEKFLKKFSYVDTIICQNKVIKGNGSIEEKINNKVFTITSKAFFQVNKVGLELINSIIETFLRDKKINKVLDLYSGIATWGILISDYVEEVTCIEVNKEACDSAKVNILKNDIKNIKVINGKVEDYINTFKNIDLIIVDPPRSGLDKITKEYLKRIKAKYIIYVSCDMLTLKRDLSDLNDCYDIKNVNLVDMFKRTYHCESVTVLEKSNNESGDYNV